MRGDSLRGNAPVELSSFVGRARELLEVRRLLAVARTVTLTGPGGIGKSRLALHASLRLERHFPDGVWMVDLTELEGPHLLPHALAHSLKVYERPDGAVEDALLAHLQGRRLLLLLDDCDGVLGECRELVSSIVSRSDGVRVLCTSRQRLGIPGEAIVALSTLEVPAAGTRLSLESIAEVEAVTLLVDRARAVAPDFALKDENCAAVSDICRRLDGLPLAIELAAVRLASLTAGDLLERLDDRFRLLSAERGPQARRHQTLRATVEWSHELLGEEERILWRRLSVFAGGFGIEAAEAVCSGGGLERDRVIDVIGRLVDSSILTMAHSGHRGRYRVLETMRLYGAERLREAGEEVELQRRHAAWCFGLVSAGDRSWWGTVDQAEVIDMLDVEWANVEAALDFCAGSAADAQMGVQMAADLWTYWLVRGRYRLGRRHLEALLAMIPAASPIRAMALWAVGFLAQATGDHDAALAGFDEAERVSAQTGGERERAYALCGLGLVGLRRGDGAKAFRLLIDSRETMVRVDDPVGHAMSLYFLATALAAAEQLSQAVSLAEEGLDVSEQTGDRFVRGVLSAVLGIVEWLLGDAEGGEAELKEAVRIQGRLGHRWGLATSLEGLAWVAASCGRFERASLLIGATASLWQELGIAPVPYWQVYRDACDAAVREGLDEAGYRAGWEQGFALRRGEEVALALEDAAPSRPQAADATDGDTFELTARELEVARLVAEGMSNPAIARSLFVSTATVKTHVSHILGKLALDSRVQLANWVAAHDSSTPASSPE